MACAGINRHAVGNEESYRKGVANHLTSSLAVAVVRPPSKRRHKASVGWDIELRKRENGMPTLCHQGEGHTGEGVNASPS